jgi:hypothetical protein
MCVLQSVDVLDSPGRPVRVEMWYAFNHMMADWIDSSTKAAW